MQPYSPFQLAQVVSHMVVTKFTRPTFDEYRPKEEHFYTNPYPVYQRMREEKPIFYVPSILGWVIGHKYETCISLLKDDRLSLRFSDWKFYPRTPENKKTELNRLTENLLMAKHRPDHQRLRRLAVPAFSPRIVDNLRPQIKATIAKHFDTLQSGDMVDIVGMAQSVPLEVLTAYLGVPGNYQKDFYAVSDAILGQFNPNTTIDLPAALKGIEMLKKMVAEKRRDPKDDLVSALATTAEDGDKLSEDEMLALIASVLAAGPDSTREQITCILHALARQPESYKALRENRDLMHNATRECFRWDGWGIRGFSRFALEDIEVLGKTIKKGEMVRLCFPVHLYDAEIFPNPEKFDLHRTNLDKVAYFGIGPHYCLGANIARTVSEMVVTEVLDRYKTISLASPAVFKENVVSRRIVSLPLKVEKA